MPADNATAEEKRIAFLSQKTMSIFKRLQELRQTMTEAKLRSCDEYDLKELLSALEELKRRFDSAQSSLEELQLESIESQLSINCDSCVSSIRLSLKREIGKRVSDPSHSTSVGALPGHTQSVSTLVVPSRARLPQLQLPHFSGSYTDWAGFFALFSAIVDKDAELTPVEKFQHLHSCISGSALDAIRSLEINDANYKPALDILIKRFDNKRLAFQAHVREIFGLAKVDGVASQLRELVDKVTANIRALQSLGSVEEVAGCIIVQLVLQKLDKGTQIKYEESADVHKMPSWENLSAFLEKRCRTLENVERAIQEPSSQRLLKTVGTNQRKAFVATNSPDCCSLCSSSNHAIYQCPEFAKLSPDLRHKKAKDLSLCINCLKKGHFSRDCKSTSCRICKLRHHSLLHFNNETRATCATSFTTPTSLIATPPNFEAALAALSSSELDVVLLATAVVTVRNHAGVAVPCRVLLDSGSQLHFITTRFANLLQLHKTKSIVACSGMGDTDLSTDRFTVNVKMQSRISDFSVDLAAIGLPVITDRQPNCKLNIASWNIPANIKLADPLFHLPERIDMLIGASIFLKLLCVGQIELAPGLPILQKTHFGWIASGGAAVPDRSLSLITQCNSQLTSVSNTRLDDLVRSFWEVEHCFEPISRVTQEELDCEEHFCKHFKRLPSGEYSVRLPTKKSSDHLGESYQQALRRLENLERKLARNPSLQKQYSAFLSEYIDLNHMSLVPTELSGQVKYLLPHHCVFKEDSTTRKLRVVFDGSAATTSGLSLNDILVAGPTIQPKLFDTLIRFRTFRIALTADIGKMYRCIRIDPADSFLQCILWRKSPQDCVKIFKLDTVTYGTKSAAFLAVRAMHQLALDEKVNFPLGSKIVQRDFYVDDMISGGDSEQEVNEIRRQTVALLGSGNFHLRKWCSNDASILADIPVSDREEMLTFNDGSEVTKALGLVWDPAKVMFLFSFAPKLVVGKHSKRSILSTVARVYDPLGLIGPV